MRVRGRLRAEEELWPLLRETNATFSALAARFAALPAPRLPSHREALEGAKLHKSQISEAVHAAGGPRSCGFGTAAGVALLSSVPQLHALQSRAQPTLALALCSNRHARLTLYEYAAPSTHTNGAWRDSAVCRAACMFGIRCLEALCAPGECLGRLAAGRAAIRSAQARCNPPHLSFSSG